MNEAFVRHHLQGRPPIGARIATRTSASPQAPVVVREIVGVARQIKGRPDETEDLLQVYVPIAQNAVDDIFLLAAPATGAATRWPHPFARPSAASTRTSSSALVT